MGGGRLGLNIGSLYACRHCKSVTADPLEVENQWCCDCEQWGPNAPADVLWKCRDGVVMHISEMTQSHLQYSIAKILREPDWRRHYMDKLLAELKRRKDLETSI